MDFHEILHRHAPCLEDHDDPSPDLSSSATSRSKLWLISIISQHLLDKLTPNIEQIFMVSHDVSYIFCCLLKYFVWKGRGASAAGEICGAGSGEQCQVSCTWTMCTLETGQPEAHVRVLFTALNCVSGESYLFGLLFLWLCSKTCYIHILFDLLFFRFLITANDHLPVHVNVLSTYKNKL